MEEGARVSIGELGAVLVHAVDVGLHISGMPHGCSPVT